MFNNNKLKLWWLVHVPDFEFEKQNAEAIEQVKQAQLRKYRVKQ